MYERILHVAIFRAKKKNKEARKKDENVSIKHPILYETNIGMIQKEFWLPSRRSARKFLKWLVESGAADEVKKAPGNKFIIYHLGEYKSRWTKDGHVYYYSLNFNLNNMSTKQFFKREKKRLKKYKNNWQNTKKQT